MTDKEVEMTLSMLKGAVYSAREKGNSVDSIRMGLELCDAIVSYNADWVYNYKGSQTLKKIMGIPVEYDYKNPYALHLVTLTSVPVFRESEVSGNEYDG